MLRRVFGARSRSGDFKPTKNLFTPESPPIALRWPMLDPFRAKNNYYRAVPRKYKASGATPFIRVIYFLDLCFF